MPPSTDEPTTTARTTTTTLPKESTTTATTTCDGCGKSFPSRNAIFKHLKETDGSCLNDEDYKNFIRYVRNNDLKKGKKVLVLYGYVPCAEKNISNGDDAAQCLMQAIQEFQKTIDGDAYMEPSAEESKYNRSYGSSQRGVDFVGQDDGTGAITEVLIARFRPLRGRSIDEWIDQVNGILNQQFNKSTNVKGLVPIRVLGRQDMPNPKFNAEMDATCRRLEYLLPMEFLSWSQDDKELRDALDKIPSFSENNRHKLGHTTELSQHRPHPKAKAFLHTFKKLMQSMATHIVDVDVTDKGAMMEKDFNVKKRKHNKNNNSKNRKDNKDKGKHKGKKNDDDDVDDEGSPEPKKSNITTKPKDNNKTNDPKKSGKPDEPYQPRMLQRKRFHNFSPTVMAHEYLAYRRVDRVYHRATLDFSHLEHSQSKPFLVLSIHGDLFLKEQVMRMVGVLVALGNGLIDPDFCDCVFDEAYPHLIPTPPAPALGMISAEANYTKWEGKLKSIFSPRNTKTYPKGWNAVSTLERVQDWQDTLYEELARQWLSEGRDSETGRLNIEKTWTETVLKPWAVKANEQLKEYRRWKQIMATQGTDNLAQDNETEGNQSGATNNEAQPEISMAPPIESVDPTIPELFEKVLYHLRQVDATGQWPGTTLKRQLVMVTTAEGEEAEENGQLSLSLAHAKAKSNQESRSSAYSFAEGQGGASGSFSVGLMPGVGNKQPKSNFLFPELVRAAFELERKLMPDREPSSTIAVNRNAQFRPHTDSGAGAGQSTSLIVGLGTYSGGDLMVEGERHDIRYKAIEFNGWKQRHWTLPFKGERYSLVWFTPKGCEGMRGIDLDLISPPPGTDITEAE